MRVNEISKVNEKIELTLPVNSAYVSAARLTASSISNRMGFDIDDIEDIKAAVSEACIFTIKQCTYTGQTNFHLAFNVVESALIVELSSTAQPREKTTPEDELGIKMIQALMDSLEIATNDASLKITMIKHKR